MSSIRVASGKMVAGKVVMERSPFEEGTKVTVIAAENNETFELGPEDEAALLDAIAAADRGELVDAAEFLDQLASKRE
jgi:hypothetical protein